MGLLNIARLRKVADDLWLENNEGRIKFEERQVADGGTIEPIV